MEGRWERRQSERSAPVPGRQPARVRVPLRRRSEFVVAYNPQAVRRENASKVPRDGVSVSGSLDVDHESSRITELEDSDAGCLGQAGTPAQGRLEVTELLDFLDSGQGVGQIPAAAVAAGARSVEDDAQTRRPAHRDRQTARILDELGRG